jgi:polyphosphate kinase 2 (PPK2 family)
MTAGRRLAQLRRALGGKLAPGAPLGPALVVVMEGWDASGKGGAIKRLLAPLDSRHVRVASYAAPTPDEKRHHYLKRFWVALPGVGGMTVFDRSWYGRVLVERVEGFATEEEWRRAYDEIVAFEHTLAAAGTIFAKFWLHISPEEQLERFERRQADPLKSWKITDEDWRNREKRPQYVEAAEEMFARTDTLEAPWILVEGDSKRFARVKVMECVIEQIERGCAARGFELPEPLEPETKV